MSIIHGTTTKVKEAVNGLLRVHPTNCLYFTDDSGKAIRLAGHQMFWDLQDHACGGQYTYNYQSTLDWNWYMNFATERNLNFIRDWIEFSIGRGSDASDPGKYNANQPYARTGPGNAVDGRPKFDLYTFNEDFFDRMHSRIQDVSKHGIYISILLFDVYNFMKSDNTPSFSRWGGNVFNLNNNINGIDCDTNSTGCGIDFFHTGDQVILDLQKAYVRKVIDTVNDFDNIFYEIANELYAQSWQTDMINYIKNYEAGKPKQHMILRSPGGVDSSLGYTFDTKSDLVGSPAEIFALCGAWPGYIGINVPANTEGKPGIWDVDHCSSTETPYTCDDYRYPWMAFTRGYNFCMYDTPFEDPCKEGANWERMRYNVGATVSYANKVADLAAMYPINELSSATHCLANPGIEYIVFQPDSSDSFTVSGLTSGRQYYYEWFDTYNHIITSTGSITPSSHIHTFYPSYSDAVLYLNRI